jgi:hypothetical protein
MISNDGEQEHEQKKQDKDIDYSGFDRGDEGILHICIDMYYNIT